MGDSDPAFLNFLILVGMVIVLTLAIAAEKEGHRFASPINLRAVDCNDGLSKLFPIQTKCSFASSKSTGARREKKLTRRAH